MLAQRVAEWPMAAGKQMFISFMFVSSREHEIHKNTNLIIKIYPSFWQIQLSCTNHTSAASAGERCSAGRTCLRSKVSQSYQEHKKQTLTFAGDLLEKTWFVPFSWKQPQRREAVMVFVKQEEGWPPWEAQMELNNEGCAGIDKNSVLRGQSQWTPPLSLQGSFLSVSAAQCSAYLVLKKDPYLR